MVVIMEEDRMTMTWMFTSCNENMDCGFSGLPVLLVCARACTAAPL